MSRERDAEEDRMQVGLGNGPLEVQLVPYSRMPPNSSILMLVLGYIPLSYGLFMLVPIIMRFEEPFDYFLLVDWSIITVLYVVMTIMFLPACWALRRATSVVMDVDGLRLMRDDEEVRSLAFDGRVRVLADLPRGGSRLEHVLGFRFGRGLRLVLFSVSPEDTARLWPVFKEALGKHHLRMGMRLTTIYNEEGYHG